MQKQKKPNGVKESVNVRKPRIEPSFKKKRKSISLAAMTWAQIDNYSDSQRVNRSQVIEKGINFFLSNKQLYDLLAHFEAKQVELAVIRQQVENIKARKKIINELVEE